MVETAILAQLVSNSVTSLVSGAIAGVVEKSGVNVAGDQLQTPVATASIEEDVEEARRGALAAIAASQDALGPDERHRITVEGVSSAHEATRQIRDEYLRQARWAFNAALALGIGGALVVLGGAALLFADATSAGVITVVVGAISEIGSVGLFALHRAASARLDGVRHDLSLTERARDAVELLGQISDARTRDEAISMIVIELGRQPV